MNVPVVAHQTGLAGLAAAGAAGAVLKSRFRAAIGA